MRHRVSEKAAIAIFLAFMFFALAWGLKYMTDSYQRSLDTVMRNEGDPFDIVVCDRTFEVMCPGALVVSCGAVDIAISVTNTFGPGAKFLISYNGSEPTAIVVQHLDSRPDLVLEAADAK